MGNVFGRESAAAHANPEVRSAAEEAAENIKKSNKSLEKIFKTIEYDPSKNIDLKNALKTIVVESLDSNAEIDKLSVDAKDIAADEKNRLKQEIEQKLTEDKTKLEEDLKNGKTMTKILFDQINNVDNANALEELIAADISDKVKIFLDKFNVPAEAKKRLKDEIKKSNDILGAADADRLYDPDRLKKLETALKNVGKIGNEWGITEFFKDTLFTKASGIRITRDLSVAVLGGLIVYWLTLSPGDNSGNPGKPGQTPSPAEITLTPRDIQAIMVLMSLNISGCYIVTNNSGNISAERLDDCSDWYNNDNNQIYCGCIKTTNLPAPQIPDCSDQTLCNAPYCLNQGTCTTPGGGKCSSKDTKKLYICNGQSLDQDGFVFYKYQFYPPSAIPSTIINLINQEDEKNNRNKLIGIIVTAVLVLIVFFVIMYIMMNKKNGNLKKIKSKK